MKTFKWDKYTKEAKRSPFVIDELPPWHPAAEPEGPGSITIPVPSGEAFLEAETAGGTGRSLELLCGPQWPAVQMLIMGGEPTWPVDDRPGDPISMPGLMEFVQDITRHFSLGEGDRPPAVGRR